jgi:hypothetical protein
MFNELKGKRKIWKISLFKFIQNFATPHRTYTVSDHFFLRAGGGSMALTLKSKLAKSVIIL